MYVPEAPAQSEWQRPASRGFDWDLGSILYVSTIKEYQGRIVNVVSLSLDLSSSMGKYSILLKLILSFNNEFLPYPMCKVTQPSSYKCTVEANVHNV